MGAAYREDYYGQSWYYASEGGRAEFEFSHVSDYVIIISDETKETLIQEKAAAIIVLILLGSMAFGIGVYLIIKRKDEK